MKFRRSDRGRLLRLFTRPGDGYFRCFSQPGGPALVAIYNADGSHGRGRLMLAVNPHTDDTSVPIGEFGG